MTEEAATQTEGKTVYLHIGTPKSGTTYIQDVLGLNKERLAERGVLWPGRTWVDQIHAVRDLVNIHPFNLRAEDVAGAWQRLADEIHAWEGPAVVISMEWLVDAQPHHIQRAVDTLAPADVQVVLTGRDLARNLPACWQESMQNWAVYTWDEYVEAVRDPESATFEVGKRIWRQQDLGNVLRRWHEVIPAERTHVVTVPPSGADPHMLWRRFASAIGLEPDDYEMPAKGSNTALGVVSAELMRRTNIRAREHRMGWKASEHMLKQVLAKRVLSKRKDAEPVVALPKDLEPWSVEQGKRIAAEVEHSGAHVWGDLTELIPNPAHARDGTTPDAISDDQLLDAALDGIVGLIDETNRKLAAHNQRHSDLRNKVDNTEKLLQGHRRLTTPQLTKRFLVELSERIRWIGRIRNLVRTVRRRAGAGRRNVTGPRQSR